MRLQKGDRGEKVMLLQAALRDEGIGLPQYGVDGIFGPETEGAVKQAQQKFSLPVTGIADQNLLNRLNISEARLTPVATGFSTETGPKSWILDWTLNSSHSRYRQNYAYGFATGGQLLGGELFFSSRGTAADGIRRENLRGQWRYPIYTTPVIRQVVAGDQMQENLFNRGTLYFRGVEITNSPNAPRQHFREFRISDHLQEGWDVELYTNNRMTGLARGSNTDSFSFSEPVRYGSNRFTLRHYSPEGFSHEDTYFMTIPHTFIPSGSIEYSLSAGSYQFYTEEFARAQLNMGVSSFLTVGGGYHVMSDYSSGYEQTPFLNTSLQLANRLMLEGSHTFGHTSVGSLRYYFEWQIDVGRCPYLLQTIAF